MFSLRKRDTALPSEMGMAGTGTAASLHRLYPTRRACGKQGPPTVQEFVMQELRGEKKKGEIETTGFSATTPG
jgi:hypothetical protein